MILYLHGFRSSPRSFKARLIAERLQARGRCAEYHCPQLPASPRDAIALVSRIMSRFSPNDVALIGSSLGGYYATWLAEKSGCRAVLLNPAVKPLRDLEKTPAEIGTHGAAARHRRRARPHRPGHAR